MTATAPINVVAYDPQGASYNCCYESRLVLPSIDFLDQVFVDDEPPHENVIYSTSIVPTYTMTMADNDDHHLVDPLILLMQHQNKEEQWGGSDDDDSNVMTMESAFEYSPSYDPVTAVTVSLPDFDDSLSVSLDDSSHSENWMVENTPSTCSSPVLLSCTIVASTMTPFSPRLPTVSAEEAVPDLSALNAFPFPAAEVPTKPVLSFSASVSDSSESSVSKQATLQQQVDDAMREFKERQQDNRKENGNCSIGSIDSINVSSKRSCSSLSGQTLEQEAREVMRQFWKRQKHDQKQEKSLTSGIDWESTYSSQMNTLAPSCLVAIERQVSSVSALNGCNALSSESPPPQPVQAPVIEEAPVLSLQIKQNVKAASQSCTSKPAPAPRKALSAYNFFFHDERDRILNGGTHDFSLSRQATLLAECWKPYKMSSDKQITFTQLSKMITQRWNALPDHQKAFYYEVSAKDWDRCQGEASAL